MFEGVGLNKACNGLKMILKLLVSLDLAGNLKHIIAILYSTVLQLMIPATFLGHSEIY